jgi:hypothetical protein
VISRTPVPAPTPTATPVVVQAKASRTPWYFVAGAIVVIAGLVVALAMRSR